MGGIQDFFNTFEFIYGFTEVEKDEKSIHNNCTGLLQDLTVYLLNLEGPGSCDSLSLHPCLRSFNVAE